MTSIDSDSSLSSDTDGVPLIDTTLKAVSLSNGGGKRARATESEESELSSDDDGAPLAKRAKSNATESSTSTTLAGLHQNNATNGIKRGAKRKLATSSSSSDDDDDAPLAAAKPKLNGKVKAEVTSDDDDGTPLAPSPANKSKATGAVKATRGSLNGTRGAAPNSKAPKKEPEDSDAEDSDDDAPLSKVAPKKKAAANGKGKVASKPLKKKLKKEESEEEEESASDSDSDAPIKSKRKPAAKPSAKVKAKPEPVSPVKKNKVKKEEESPVKKGKKKKKEEEEEEDLHRWWEVEQIQGDGSVKWTTLEHHGVLFPPPYKPLPSNVKMKYDGRSVTLSPAAEEVAGFFGALLGSDHAEDKKFQENFFKDWLVVLKDNPSADSAKIKKFELCDFRPMFEHFEAEKAAKKAMTNAEKKALKAEKTKFEEPYVTCLLDGRKEKVGNFRAEPPGLFRGRGEHPKKGCLKFRLTPEDITLNIGEKAKIPTPNVPGKWGSIVHDNTVTWLATWKENINGNF
ncbi:DNA topoisomerase 1, partial [Tulasnella sp. 427]